VNCELRELRVWNDEFVVTHGHQYFDRGVLDFKCNPNTLDCTYRTVFGPSAPHAFDMYADNDNNVAQAIWRLCGKREPGNPGVHELLRVNQRTFLQTHAQVFGSLSELYKSHFPAYIVASEEVAAHVHDPHPKKVLREEAWTELIDSGEGYLSSTWLRGKRVRWKMKRDEWAKPGKKPRMIADLGVAASLRGFRVTEYMKRAQSSENFRYKGGVMAFCKSPDPGEMAKHFMNLINPPGRYYFVYFSDDACLSYRYNGRVYFHNLDISSCDASHTGALFDTLINITPEPFKNEMRLLVAQCASKLRIISRTDPKRLVDLVPREPKLYSGSTLTTAINNVANISICMAIADLDQIRPELIAGAAATAGYIVTGVEPLEFPEDLQFLKHSPVRDSEGYWRAMLNFGVFARASGTCRGDLPGPSTMSLLQRGKAFQHALLRGAYPTVRANVIDTMRETYALDYSLDELSASIVTPLEEKTRWTPSFKVDEASFMRRYRMTPADHEELLDFAKHGYGFSCGYPVLDKILVKDYGLGLRTTFDRPVVLDPNLYPHLHSCRN